MNKIVSFESVAQAADALVAAGERPSVRKVIASLGGGSPNTVLGHISTWKAGRVTVAPAAVTLDPQIAALISNQVEQAARNAAKTAEQQAADAIADAEAVAEAGRAAEERAVELDAALVELRDQLQHKEGQIAELRSELSLAKSAADTWHEQAGQHAQEAAVSRARLDAAHETVAASQQRESVLIAKLNEVEARERALNEALTSARVQVQAQKIALDTAARELEKARQPARKAPKQSSAE